MNALSDAVFGVVLTLLVLDLKLPEPPGRGAELFRELAANVPDIVSWLVSFLVLARVWAIHHAVTANMSRCHLGTIMLNFLLLGAISLTPFAASLVGFFRFSEEWATGVFSLNLGLVGLSLGLFARHVAREPHLQVESPVDLRWHWIHHAWLMPSIAVAAGALAVVHHPLTAFGVWGAEFLVVFAFALKDVWSGRTPERTEPA